MINHKDLKYLLSLDCVTVIIYYLFLGKRVRERESGAKRAGRKRVHDGQDGKDEKKNER